MALSTTEYMNGAVKVLAGLSSNAARAALLAEKIEDLNQTYERWMRHVDRGGDPGGMTAWDFSERIAALEQELGKYRVKEAA